MIQSRKGFNRPRVEVTETAKQEVVKNKKVETTKKEAPKAVKAVAKKAQPAIKKQGSKSKLKEQFAFLLYACAKETTRKYKSLLRDTGLTYTQYITLLALWDKDGINVKTLGEQLYLDSGTLTPMLRKMEDTGFIKRKHTAKDERNLIVLLTEKGKAFENEMKQLEKRAFAELPLSEKEARQLAVSLGKMIEGF